MLSRGFVGWLPARAPRFLSTAVAAAAAADTSAANLKTVKSLADYKALKLSSGPVLVGWFRAHWSLPCKLFESDFDALASRFPQYTFFKADIDEVPKAAYDMEVTDVPSIAILPFGLRPDGTLYDKTDLRVVQAELTDYKRLVSDAEGVISSVEFNSGEEPPPREPWVFDPATGTTLPKHQSY